MAASVENYNGLLGVDCRTWLLEDPTVGLTIWPTLTQNQALYAQLSLPLAGSQAQSQLPVPALLTSADASAVRDHLGIRGFRAGGFVAFFWVLGVQRDLWHKVCGTQGIEF